MQIFTSIFWTVAFPFTLFISLTALPITWLIDGRTKPFKTHWKKYWELFHPFSHTEKPKIERVKILGLLLCFLIGFFNEELFNFFNYLWTL